MSDYKCQSFLWAHTDSNILISTLNIHLLNKWQSQSAMNRPPPKKKKLVQLHIKL